MSFQRFYPKKLPDDKLGCPECGHPKFRFGPSGGMSQNVECGGCETRWNATFIDGIPWEKLSTVSEREKKTQVANFDELSAK